jgi:glycosyltransferase involved in cell wall biosynthesis
MLTILNVAFPFARVGPEAVGGAEQITTRLDSALVAEGHRSIVVACEGSRVDGLHWPVPAEEGPLDGGARQRAWDAHRRAIEEVRRRFPIDLVHLHGIDFDAYCPTDGATLVTLHLPLDWYPRGALRSRRADLAMHGVSAIQMRGASPEFWFLPPIENGVDTKVLTPKHAKRGYALFLGRICPEKGVHLAIAAARRAEVPLIIAGQVFRYEAHERYFAEEISPRLDAACRFVGPVGLVGKRRLLSAARCLLVASRAEETSSLVAMEALACGTAVVAFRKGALPEIVDHGRTGFVVDTVDEMADAIHAARRIDRSVCRREAEARFSQETMTAAYFKRYDELARPRVAAA